MMPNISRGGQMGGLLVYLAGEGRSNEHEEQHLVAGDAAIMAQHGYSVLDRDTALAIAKSLDAPRRAFEVEVLRTVKDSDPATGAVTSKRVAGDVWHCSLSLRAEEGQLSDEKWGAIAQDFADRMGFTEASGKAACRWVAVRHGLSTNGNDHVHLAVSLVREDGTKASTHNDFKRAQDVCRDLEREYGLEQLESRGQGLGERGVKPAERERATRTNRVEIDAHKMERTVRAAATASVEEGEFVRRLRRGGVLIRPRFAAGRDDVVAGYSVAVRPQAGEKPIWYGGGRLARDLTLPRLREGWPDSPESAQGAVDEWRATAKNPWQYRPVAPGREETTPSPEMWKQYSDEIGQLRKQLRDVPVSDRATWAHVARETSGVFAAWSQRVEATPGPLAQTSRELARSAHLRAHQSRPKPVQLGSGANAAMILMQAAAVAGGQDTMAQAIMLRQLGRVSVAILDMHTALGDARRAEQVAAMMRTQFAAMSDRLPPVPTTGAPNAGTRTADVPDVMRRATEGLASPRAGSPIPTILTPHKPKTPSTPRERDGRGRE
ncbi:relaxase/mobilization nuclease domain-containing protein [Cryobacterium arcticum]|uniref:Relaxase n=1 Tax=Cryobacterium arcticum TaxID=670052 RepID=A0A1B1BQP0_9MICO|nr:relaxase/mobilization nuclease domain-containing protein [Cryobacterium arcticum]ANP74875.1 relaxase [Cryobacterium arcticum]